MKINSAQEALFVACEMERGAIQLYERSLMLLSSLGREKEPLRAHLASMLADEKQHLLQFQELYTGLEASVEEQLALSAVASSVLFDGGLMGAVRQGLLQDERSMLSFAANAEQTAAATYRGFSEQSNDPHASEMLTGIALEEDKHLKTLREHLASLEA
ncbi:MAG TPA: ferritin-like domain-containing protein [Candidatus Limiplasma sp.]|jgi:rubrerythrin|nr:ferritin-like domain-containing protein [Candidatus Limiplasma sp.]HPR77870.1 ferritin-like domain-containing protein [Candidatus Limiplasma sp.]